jgi:O-antigen/teichoic acid export membrane protein
VSQNSLRKLLHSSLAIALARSAGIIATFVCVPVIINTNGQIGYGVWECILAVSGIAQLLQTVFGVTLNWQMSSQFGRNNLAAIRRLVRLGIGTSLLSAVFFPICFLFIETEIAEYLKLDDHWKEVFFDIGVLTVFLTSMSGINETLLSVSVACQKSGMAACLQATGAILGSVVSVVFVLNDSGLIGLVYGQATTFVSVFVLSMWHGKKLIDHVHIMPLLPNWSELRILSGFGSLILISNIALLSRDHFDRLLVSNVNSIEVTADMGVARHVSAAIAVVCGFIVVPLSASVAKLEGQGDINAGKAIFEKANKVVCIFSGLLTCLVCSTHTSIMILWLGSDKPDSKVFLAIMLLGVTTATMFGAAPSSFARGIGKPGLETISSLFTMISTSILKIILTFSLGSYGTVLSSSISWGAGGVLLMFLVIKTSNLGARNFLIVWQLFLVTVFLAVAGWGVNELFAEELNSRLDAFLYALVSVPTTAFLFLFLCFLCSICNQWIFNKGI